MVAAVAAAREFDVPVVPRGGGTSLAGNSTGNGLVLDLTRLNRIEIDPATRTAFVEPGVVLDDLQAAAAPHGLTFGPDPSTHSRCTLGGMIGNNSCGSHSVAWGTTLDNVVSLDVLRYDGERMTVGRHARSCRRSCGRWWTRTWPCCGPSWAGSAGRCPGYPLHQLLPEHGRDLAKALVGTEGTCVTVLGATGPAGRAAGRRGRCSCSVSPTTSPRRTRCRRSCRTSR